MHGVGDRYLGIVAWHYSQVAETGAQFNLPAGLQAPCLRLRDRVLVTCMQKGSAGEKQKKHNPEDPSDHKSPAFVMSRKGPNRSAYCTPRRLRHEACFGRRQEWKCAHFVLSF